MPDTDQATQEIIDGTNDLREYFAEGARRLKTLEAVAKPPVVQELVIARRSAEDSRYRLGYAGAYARGLDPLAHTFPDQKEKVQ